MVWNIRRVVTRHDEQGRSTFLMDGLAPNIDAARRADRCLEDHDRAGRQQRQLLVQRGTVHSWSVRGTEPCVVAAVLIGAKPAP